MVSQVSKQSTQGGVGSCIPSLVDQGREARPGNELEQSLHLVQAMSLEPNLPQETLDALADEISAEGAMQAMRLHIVLSVRSIRAVSCLLSASSHVGQAQR